MQSSKAKTREWVLEVGGVAPLPDPLMGWAQSRDMDGQVRLSFVTREEAIAYAQSHAIAFQVMEPKPVRRVIKAYAENFAFTRKEPWTH